MSDVIDEPLSISPEAVHQLEAFRVSEKFTALPGTDTTEELARLSAVFNALLDRLIAGVLSNPNKLWVMLQFQQSLDAVSMEDTEGRERFGTHLERVMDILRIESSDGLLGFYL